MLPPNARGTVTFIAPEGDYNIHETILESEYDGKKSKHSMSHFWPVRKPRPVVEKLAGNTPLLTG